MEIQIPNEVLLVQADDWEELWFDGDKVIEGHSLSAFHILDALGVKYVSVELDSEAKYEEFTDKMTVKAPHKYKWSSV